MQPRVRDSGRGRGRGARPFLIVVAAAVLPLLPGCSSITPSSAPSATAVRTSADAAPASDSGTTVGSLRQSYVGFLNAFRDPADQTPASPPPNPPDAAGRVGPAAASGPATVAAATLPPDAQSFRPVPPGYYTPSAPPYKPADQPSAAAPPGAATAAAPSAPPTNPPPAAADRPYALESFLNIFR
jgi:hypothetical protein